MTPHRTTLRDRTRSLVGATLTVATLALPLTGALRAEAATTSGPLKVDFAPSGATVPTGYVRDTGGAYSASRGYGWISQTTSAPLSLVGNTRDRNLVDDQRLDTLIAMQSSGSGGSVATPGRWEADVADGIYDVTVAVGDVGATSGSKHRITVEGTNLINDFVPSTSSKTATVTGRIRVGDGKVTVDAAGGTGTKLDYVDIVPVSGVIGAGATLARINFAPSGTTAPHRYVNDTGAGYTSAKGYGWINQTSSTPLSVVGNSRDRDSARLADQRLDTFTCMQYGGTGGTNKPARWQYALPAGTYDVTVSVGDATTITGSKHRLAAEGVVAIKDFVPTSTTRFKQATVRVSVTDGFLTLDAAGGTNTKINFVQIVDADGAPRTITSVSPADGTGDAPVDSAVVLTPSHPVDPATVGATTVQVLAPGGAAVSGTYEPAAGGGTIRFTPASTLTPATTYTVQTTAGLRDTKGNPFAPSTTSFTTVAPVTSRFARVNFQPQGAVVPDGYSKDHGQGFDAGRGYGWVEPGTATPVSLVGQGRERELRTDQRIDTLLLMQGAVSGDWQVAVPSGTYSVTVSVGDPANSYDSTDAISAEGTTVVAPFTPTAGDKFEEGTVEVQVTDGYLTLSATGGTNTKIDYVDIDRITLGPPPADSWSPTVELTTTGAGGPTSFTGPVSVAATTTDLGTGVASLAYRIDGGPSTQYEEPVTVNAPGDHTVVVTATDGAGNAGSSSSTFSVTRPDGSPAIAVTAAEDVLGLSSRLVFSTTRGAVTPARSATVTNTGASDLVISGIELGGTNPNQFALEDGQATSLTIPAGGSATVAARFIATTSFGVKTALLTLTTNDPLNPTYSLTLRGVNAGGNVGETEPTLSELMSVFGYSTVTGITGIDQATTRAPVGDEVIAPYFKRVDTTKPVTLRPIARYVAATSATSDTGYAPTKGSAARNVLYRFPADVIDADPDDGVDSTQFVENQKVMPAITPGGTTSWNPAGVFGIAANYANYTDDQFNRDEAGTTFHNLRVFPAKAPGGAVLPNTWLVVVDINLSGDKNFDYQDQIMLLGNATPELAPATAIGGATTLGFDAPVAGTVLDGDGQGTGFTSVQPNTAGTQYRAEKIDLTGGTLRITSTDGKSSGAANTQDNALQLHVDASRSDFAVQGRILGPMSDLTLGYQQKAVWFGPNQDNYLKVEIEHRIDKPGVFITAFLEVGGTTSTIGQVAVPNPGAVTTLDLQITGDLETNTLQAGYRINSSGSWTTLGTPFVPTNVYQWFSPQGRAGVLVSHNGTTTPVTGTFDWFRIV